MSARTFDRSEPGFIVIMSDDLVPALPVCCPVCRLCLRTSDDERRMMDDGCCAACGLRFVDPDRERWRLGWRPDDVSVADAVAERPRIPIRLEFD